jgi:RNA methyltransferase, TrmH family
VSIEKVTSRQNALVRQFREVAQGSVADAILLDGEHLIEEALTSGLAIDVVAFSEPLATSTLAHRLNGSRTKVVTVSTTVLDAISPVQSPSGAVAIARRPGSSLERVFMKTPQLILMLHDLQDPGNVGAIVRAAEACGATGIVCSERTADPFGWKALRGSMGSSFRVPLATKQALAEALAMARDNGLRIFATIARGGTTLPDCNLRKPAAILLGGEGGGLPPGIIEEADERLSIPMQAPVESLNVSVAAALVMYEATRQRQSDRAHVAL